MKPFFNDKDKAVFTSWRYWLSLIPQVVGLCVIAWAGSKPASGCYTIGEIAGYLGTIAIGLVITGAAVWWRMDLYDEIEHRIGKKF